MEEGQMVGTQDDTRSVKQFAPEEAHQGDSALAPGICQHVVEDGLHLRTELEAEGMGKGPEQLLIEEDEEAAHLPTKLYAPTP
jgi:hypothetical protein